jgi:NADP-dependent 3-hydroxy acid dehydrogenase YdfG
MAVIDKPGLAWVTGASSGIGRELAISLCKRGWKVVASARGEAQLAELAAAASGSGAIMPLPLDIADSVAVDEAVAGIVAAHGPLDLAILNAGTHIPTPADRFDRDTVRQLVDVNMMGTVNCLGALLPGFIARHGGEIAVVSSMTGYCGLPTAAAYGATKAALINMCEALRPELELHSVSLRLIDPGFIDTPLTRRNRFPMPFLTSADKGAAAILRGLGSRRFEITVPRRMAFLMKLLRLLPYPLFFAVTRRITPAPGSGAS